ncbi:hypothetical protein B0H13DRAFT_2421156 [Mycena leptocephala]|nr:hypothetical protein B0H13DRAFT_2421156 [Mycena leptocephala]
MPPIPIQTRLNNITTCLAVTADTLQILASSLKTPFLGIISNTTQSLLKNVQRVRQNRSDCAELLEQTYELLNAVLMVHVRSETGGVLPPSVLSHIGKFTETLHKIHTFVEAQQSASKVRNFFRQGEMSTLFKDCKVGLQQGFEIFQINTQNIMKDIAEMQRDAENRHNDMLDMIEALLDTSSSDGASLISRIYSGSHTSSNSISMLPSEPKIFHGRASELSDILQLFGQGTPRIVILGAGGMGKTSLARAIIHHTEIAARYQQHRFFIGCDSVATQAELTALIGAHLGLKPGKDLTRPVIQHLANSPESLLILDNLETVWEAAESRSNIEEFLSLLADVNHLSLVITMRGAERPAKVAWTRPFLQPLKPLDPDAARQTFIDIADGVHDPEEVNKVLSLTDNMPLAINLMAHLVDSEGCSSVLSHWEEEKTSLISDGYDKRSNLDLSISMSLSSPRLNSFPHSKELLSLLSMLPDGLSDVELVQAKLPIDNILGCKAALIRTTLAYIDEHKRLKALVPIREYIQNIQPPGAHLFQPLLKYFRELLALFIEYHGTQSSSTIVPRVLSNYSNIQNILQNGAQREHTDLVNTIYCACDLNYSSELVGRGPIPFTSQIQNLLPQPRDHHLEAYFIVQSFAFGPRYPISNPETLVSQGLEHFKNFDDPDLKCRFYNVVSNYYEMNHDISTATKFCETAISLALSTSNIKKHSQGLYNLSWINWATGDFSESLAHASEAGRLARISADLHAEARTLQIRSMCCSTLGNYKQCISFCSRARDLLALCGMSSGELDHSIMATQAEIHKLKSEYVEAHSIHSQILQETSVDQNFYAYGSTLVNIAEIAVSIGAPLEDVEGNCETAREIFNTAGYVGGGTMCDKVLANLYLREGNLLAAKTLFERCLKLSSIHHEIHSYCLERLGDASHWGAHVPSSTTVFLAHSVRRKEKAGIHKALQLLGDVFLTQDDEHTAVNLFTAALEGFTYMDVHQSRAECLLRLGDISKKQNNLFQAVEFWETAGPLFKRSTQAKQVENIDQRLADVGEDVLKQHRKNLTRLEELSVPSVTININDLEDMEGPSLDEKKQRT